MRELKIGTRIITDDDCFVIAEIGANHGGDPDLCEKMIIAAAKCGVDAVKMQKRNNKEMFTKTALAAPYANDLSYGATYGEHREHLDWFGKKEFLRFKAVAEKYGVIFFATPFEEDSADFLRDIGVPLWKIASCDVTNLPLVRKVAEYGQPMIISTGGATLDEIQALWRAIHKINDNFAFLHCISTYPNQDNTLSLQFIQQLRDMFISQPIGFSSPHPGILPLMVARTLGASIFEVHFTLNRGERGTDHGFSMEPRGLDTICQDLKRIKVMLGTGGKAVMPQEKEGFIRKMGKSIYVNRQMMAGEVLDRGVLCVKSPAGGLPPSELDEIVGKRLLNDFSTGIALQKEDIR